jgi:hypothetical protein
MSALPAFRPSRRLATIPHLAGLAFAGQKRLYGVRASVWVPLARGAMPQRITLAAIWHLAVEDAIGSEQTVAGRLQVRALDVDPAAAPSRVALELSHTHIVTFRRQRLVNVEAASTFANELVSRLARTLSGAPASPHDSIRIALSA